MKILNVKIEDFGCFSDRSFELSRGLNLIEGPNESGKSTLLSFIKFILYGMPKKSSETAAERMRSISWRTGTASGSLLIESGDKTYTVSRRGVLRQTAKRESYTEECRIIDEDLGIEVHKGECPGELFLGVPLSVFESTCFVRQLGSSDIDKDDVSRALENMLVSADESLSLSRALEKIDGARRLYRHKHGKGGSIPELEAAELSLKSRLAKAQGDYEKILAKTDLINETRAKITEKRAELDRLEDTVSALASVNIIKRFDLLHEGERRLGVAEDELKKYSDECVASFGSIPTDEHARALAQADATEKNAEALCSEASDQHKAASDAMQKFSNEYFAQFNEKVRRTADQKSVCDAIKRNSERNEAKKRAATRSFVAMAVLAAASAVGFFLFIPAGIGLVALAAVMLALGISARSTAKRLYAETRNELSSYGASLPDGDLSAGLESLSAIFKKYNAGVARLSEHERSVSMAESALRLREADLGTCRAATELLMSRWRGGEDTAEGAVRKANEIISRLSELSGRVRQLDSTVSAMRSELDGYDEKDLRARVPESLLNRITVKDIEKAEEEKRFVSMALRQLSDKCLSAERELIMLEKETENPVRLSAELEETAERIAAESFTLDALVLAAESLELASGNIRSTVTPLLRSQASEFMSVLTDDKYSSVGIDEEYNMSAQSDGTTHQIALLSAGTQDLAYISLRMALLSVFYKDELPPLTLDDALTQLDDARAKNALRLLAAYSERNGQSLLFTCHKRERKLLADIGEANIIEL